MKLSKFTALLLAVVMFICIIPSNCFVRDEAKAATKITYQKYRYGTYPSGDCGYVLAPDVEGTYPAGIFVHGNHSYSSVTDNVRKAMDEWVNSGLIEPMIVVTPHIMQTSSTTDHLHFVSGGGLAKVIKRLDDGTYDKLTGCKVDTSKKYALTGWSFGGAVAVYGGSKYRDSISYVGSISPAAQGHFPGDQYGYQSWMLDDPETKDLQFTNDKDHYFYLAASATEENCGHKEVIDCQYNEFGEAQGFTSVTWKNGSHSWALFKEELFFFLYTLQQGKEPSDEVWQQVFGKVPDITVVNPDTVVEKEPFKADVSFSTPQKYSFALTANVKNSNAVKFAFHWKRDGEIIEGARNNNFILKEEDIGHIISCDVSDLLGRTSGSITVTSDKIQKADGPGAPKGLVAGDNGNILNVTDAMEYATKSDFSNSVPCTGTEITGLPKGKYYVRYMETATHKNGAIATVTVTQSEFTTLPTDTPVPSVTTTAATTTKAATTTTTTARASTTKASKTTTKASTTKTSTTTTKAKTTSSSTSKKSTTTTTKTSTTTTKATTSTAKASTTKLTTSTTANRTTSATSTSRTRTTRRRRTTTTTTKLTTTTPTTTSTTTKAATTPKVTTTSTTTTKATTTTPKATTTKAKTTTTPKVTTTSTTTTRAKTTTTPKVTTTSTTTTKAKTTTTPKVTTTSTTTTKAKTTTTPKVTTTSTTTTKATTTSTTATKATTSTTTTKATTTTPKATTTSTTTTKATTTTPKATTTSTTTTKATTTTPKATTTSTTTTKATTTTPKATTTSTTTTKATTTTPKATTTSTTTTKATTTTPKVTTTSTTTTKATTSTTTTTTTTTTTKATTSTTTTTTTTTATKATTSTTTTTTTTTTTKATTSTTTTTTTTTATKATTSTTTTTTTTTATKATTSTTTTTTAATTTTAPVTTTTKPVYKLGDLNNDGLIDAVDGSSALAHYAKLSTNQNGVLDDDQQQAADINGDGIIDAVDASVILAYYAYAATQKDSLMPMEEFKTRRK